MADRLPGMQAVLPFRLRLQWQTFSTDVSWGQAIPAPASCRNNSQVWKHIARCSLLKPLSDRRHHCAAHIAADHTLFPMHVLNFFHRNQWMEEIADHVFLQN